MAQITTILTEKIQQKNSILTKFFTEKFAIHPPLFYNSIDLRNSGLKIAPIDTNCFPAGFNNLTSSGKNLAKKLVAEFFANHQLEPKKIIIIAESHTRNMRYFENLLVLAEILKNHSEVRICSLNPEIAAETEIMLDSGSKLTLHPLQKNNDRLATDESFIADLAILNNDLTDGLPEILKNTITKILPQTALGWFQRSKNKHFEIYNQLACELAEILEIDPWLISSFSQKIDKIDFKQQFGLERLALAVEEVLAKTNAKYQEYGIEEKAYCFVKADNGTYGMAVWAVSSGDDIRNINKKERNKMNMVKGTVQNHAVMIQEGIKTIDTILGSPCEPMIYLVNGQVVENLFRFNESRDEKISLNAGGAQFASLNNLPKPNSFESQESPKLLAVAAVYEIIARLASLAASQEFKNLETTNFI